MLPPRGSLRPQLPELPEKSLGHCPVSRRPQDGLEMIKGPISKLMLRVAKEKGL